MEGTDTAGAVYDVGAAFIAEQGFQDGFVRMGRIPDRQDADIIEPRGGGMTAAVEFSDRQRPEFLRHFLRPESVLLVGFCKITGGL